MVTVDEFRELLNSSPTRDTLLHQRAFESLMKDIDVGTFVAEELKRTLLDYKYVPHLRSPTNLNLFCGQWFEVSLFLVSNKDFENYATTHPSSTIFYFLRPGKYKLYTLHGYKNDIFDTDARISLASEGVIKPGQTMAIDASKQILCLCGEHPILSVTLAHITMSPFLWQFDCPTSSVIRHFNTHALSTVLELISKVLGAYGNTESIECLKVLLDHENDNIKWQAAAALTTIDLEEGRKAFTQLAATSKSKFLVKASRATLDEMRKVN